MPGRGPLERTFDLLVRSTLPEAQEAMRAGLAETNPRVQAVALAALLAAADPQAPRLAIAAFDRLGEPALELLRREGDAVQGWVRGNLLRLAGPLRENAVRFLAHIASPQSLDLLVLALNDPEAESRERAALAIRRVVAELAAASAAALDTGERRRLAQERSRALKLLASAFEMYDRHRERAVFEAILILGHDAFGILSRALRQDGGWKVRSPAKDLVLAELESSREPVILDYLAHLFADEQLVYLARSVHARRDPDPEYRAGLAAAASRLPLRELAALPSRAASVGWIELLARHAAFLAEEGAHHALALAREVPQPAARAALLELLAACPHASVRLAVLELWKTVDPATGWRLVESALSSDHVLLQKRGLEIVLAEKPEHLTRLLTPLLSSPRPEVRDPAARALADVGLARYLATFDRLSPEARERAAQVLAKIDPGVPERVAAELASLEADKRLRALQVLESMGHEEAAREHLRRLLGDDDKKVRATVVNFLGALGTVETIQLLLSALQDPDRRVRANVIEALELVSSPHVTKLLLPYLEHPDNRIRGNAIKALWKLGYRETLGVIEGMFASPEINMRLTAIWLVGELVLTGLRPRLEAMANRDREEKVRKKAMSTLARLTAQEEAAPA